MQYKKVGRTGFKVSAISIGTMIFGTQVNEAEAIKIMDLAFEKGINLFDTANAYTGGQSEEIVGKALKNKRHECGFSYQSRPQAGPRSQRLWSFPRTYYA